MLRHTGQFTFCNLQLSASTLESVKKAFTGFQELGEEVHVVRLSMVNIHRQYKSHGWVHICLTSGKFSTTPGTLISKAF
jgi:hypothetical protein